MLRVLQVVNDMQRAGLETVLMNYYRHIDRSQVQFDFLTHRPDAAAYDAEIEALGGRIYHMPRLYPQHYPQYFRAMAAFFAAHPEYRIVHAHIDAMSALPLAAARRAKVPVRIAHSHNTGIDRDAKLPLKLLFKTLLPAQATDYFACGQAAGRFLFGNRPFSVMKNAIDVPQFQFAADRRVAIRAALGASTDQFVIGCIGRLSYQKNHAFLLNALAPVFAARPNAVLWLVGEGADRAALEKQAVRLGIGDHVRFLGSRADTADLYQGMDCFVLPSRFEGIPVVGIEAQAAGLPCLLAAAVDDEAIYGRHVTKLPLTQAAWTQALLAQQPLADRTVSDFGGYAVATAQADLTAAYLALAARGRD
ncbi:glycosyltransferase [Lacticaseibacillus suihuaensis]